jgi:hypothetical protein
VIFLMINVLLFVLGTFLDMAATILICTPIFLPIASSSAWTAAVRHGDADQLRAGPEHAAGGHGAVRRLRHRRGVGRPGDAHHLAVLWRAEPWSPVPAAGDLRAGVFAVAALDAAHGTLTPMAPRDIAVRAGAGPRHLAFHPGGRFVYLLNELDASVDVFSLEPHSGALACVQSVPALPPAFSGEPWAAELRLTPDARFLYTSERRSSTLAGFAVGANGRLAPIGHWPTQAQPRGFAISPSGRWLIAAGQLSNAVNVHAIDTATGHLTMRHEHAVGRNPNWVEAIALT